MQGEEFNSKCNTTQCRDIQAKVHGRGRRGTQGLVGSVIYKVVKVLHGDITRQYVRISKQSETT